MKRLPSLVLATSAGEAMLEEPNAWSAPLKVRPSGLDLTRTSCVQAAYPREVERCAIRGEGGPVLAAFAKGDLSRAVEHLSIRG